MSSRDYPENRSSTLRSYHRARSRSPSSRGPRIDDDRDRPSSSSRRYDASYDRNNRPSSSSHHRNRYEQSEKPRTRDGRYGVSDGHRSHRHRREEERPSHHGTQDRYRSSSSHHDSDRNRPSRHSREDLDRYPPASAPSSLHRPSSSRREHRSPSPPRRRRSRSPLPPAPPAEGHTENQHQQGQEQDQDEGPNFEPSGLLAAESNSKDGVALKYHEPPEARKPNKPWRMYVFKDGKEVDMIPLGSQSAYLLGRDRLVVDIPLDHPSCSKQHAVIQFRRTVTRNEFGDEKVRVRPFLIDLESANGCTVNQTDVPASRYYEIKNGDSIQFGASSREYVCIDEGAS
ncbi:hypothetical protein ACQY0O_008264 [Thecaphora frezii]